MQYNKSVENREVDIVYKLLGLMVVLLLSYSETLFAADKFVYVSGCKGTIYVSPIFTKKRSCVLRYRVEDITALTTPRAIKWCKANLRCIFGPPLVEVISGHSGKVRTVKHLGRVQTIPAYECVLTCEDILLSDSLEDLKKIKNSDARILSLENSLITKANEIEGLKNRINQLEK